MDPRFSNGSYLSSFSLQPDVVSFGRTSQPICSYLVGSSSDACYNINADKWFSCWIYKDYCFIKDKVEKIQLKGFLEDGLYKLQVPILERPRVAINSLFTKISTNKMDPHFSKGSYFFPLLCSMMFLVLVLLVNQFVHLHLVTLVVLVTTLRLINIFCFTNI